MPATAGKSHTPPPTYAPPPKRRNIRKGTRSCWECKRRKARCTFENACDTVCIGCSRRGSACVSQEYPEETSQARQSSERRREHFARIGRMVVQIVKEEAMAEPSPDLVDDWKPENEVEAGVERLDGELGTPGGVEYTAAHITAQVRQYLISNILSKEANLQRIVLAEKYQYAATTCRSRCSDYRTHQRL